MARAAKATSAKKPATPRCKPGRPAASVKASAKAPAAASKRPTAASSAATPSKDELRALVEKLEASNATLRTKNRGANRAAKITAARIAELEQQVAQLEKQAPLPPSAPPSSAKKSRPKPVVPARGKRQRRVVDPGDSVPPNVAVDEAAHPDEAAETTLENPEKTLHAE
jgi:hypothetical protein